MALDLIDLALEEAERLGGVTVAALHVRVGPLSGVEATALSSAFELASAGTALADARLALDIEAITAWCASCGAVMTLPHPWSRVCPSCERLLPELLTGDRLQLTALEVVDRAPADR
jgi:hydrogenase nickel incorporation protein HypA/HybF